MKKKLNVQSPNVEYFDDEIKSKYSYNHVVCSEGPDSKLNVKPMRTDIIFKTKTKLPKLGLMMIGWGGNNGSTLTAAILANKQKLNWVTKDGLFSANYFGSITQCSTVFIGKDNNNQDVYVPMSDLLPMVNPNDIYLDGWDVSSLNIGDAVRRSKVLDINLQEKLYDELCKYKPRKAIYDIDFIAKNQVDRADNVIENTDKWYNVEKIRSNIIDFREKNNLDKVIVIWTANTERFVNVKQGIHDTADNLIKSIKNNENEISSSMLYAVGSILAGSTFINGSPQNTFVDGIIELAERHHVFIGGDDFKSGQTKFKSVLFDFLINAGIKPRSIVSYNHLGNNDGYNLSEPEQFRSKEISKLGVVEDMVKSNSILYPNLEKDFPDHVVVIKYVPFVGDSKRAMDEYSSELMLGGRNTIVVHNTCEDSLLAAPLIIDLVILSELFDRVRFCIINQNKQDEKKWQPFNCVLSILSYLLKSPIVERDSLVINSLFKQRSYIENMLRALIGLPPIDNLDFKSRLSDRNKWFEYEV